MMRSLRNAIQQRGERSREALLQRLEGELDGIYDLIYQMCGDEPHSVQILQNVLRRAASLSKRERYEKYLRLWALGVTVDRIRVSYPRFLAECTNDQVVPLEFLNMEEKLVFFLRDRSRLSLEEIASVMQIPLGRVGRYLAHAREKVARESLQLQWETEESLTLNERLAWNRDLEQSCEPSPAAAAYRGAMSQACALVAGAPALRFVEIESSVRHQKLLPLLGRTERVRWHDLSWRTKLGVEASVLGAVGMLAVLVLPWMMTRVNTTAFVEGRFADVFRADHSIESTAQVEEISADRLLALNEQAGEERAPSSSDEFADMEFPSGDGVEAGTAPIAPSRQSATVYRLIVQSASPQELIPHVRTVFAERQVRERESSGRVMPGGVYFDGVTSVRDYPQILQAMQKLGQTKTYSNGNSRNPNERARVIVWVQQI